MKFETRKIDVLYLIGDDGVELASYSSEGGYHANVEGLDPDLEGDMKQRLGWHGLAEYGPSYEMSE